MVRKSIVITVIWLFLSVCIFTVYYGQGYGFQIDETYQLWGWPGRLAESDHTGAYMLVVEIKEKVESYTTGDRFIVGKTKSGWFAVDRKSKEVLYPYDSAEKLEAVIGPEMFGRKWQTSAPWMKLVGKWKCLGLCAATGLALALLAVITGISKRGRRSEK